MRNNILKFIKIFFVLFVVILLYGKLFGFKYMMISPLSWNELFSRNNLFSQSLDFR
jgi:hypothetical protein